MACQHRGCNCPEASVTRGAKTYCSDRCAVIDTTGKHEKSCPCGHPGCKGSQPKQKSAPTR